MAKRNGDPVELQNMVATQIPVSEEDAELQLAEPTSIQTNADLGAFPCKVKYVPMINSSSCFFFFFFSNIYFPSFQNSRNQCFDSDLCGNINLEWFCVF